MNFNFYKGYYRTLFSFFVKTRILLHFLPSTFDNARKKNIRKMILFQTPTHGNRGDHAIAIAEKKFIEVNYPDYYFWEIPYDDIIREIKEIKNTINKDDIILIQGGGNIGEMYYWEEFMRRFIIATFKDTPVISFPQTVSFSPSRIGKRELKKSQMIYSKNKNLLLVARETKTYELMKSYFPKTDVILTPDIVLSLNERKETVRSGLLACFRNDGEQSISNVFKSEIINTIKQRYGQVQVTDTVVDYEINEMSREKELKKIWDIFRASEIVLTDRLHGMIFCAITSTPCIVFSNFNHKIEYSYKNWLSELNYIKFLDKDASESDVIQAIEQLKHLPQKSVLDLSTKFEPLLNYIDNIRNTISEQEQIL